MIFYTPKNSEGRVILCTSQIDSDKIQKNAEKIDIPTDKAGLKITLQESLDRIFELEQKQLNSEPDTSDIPEATEEFFQKAKLVEPNTKREELVNRAYEATEIEHFILNVASPAHVANIFQCLGVRFAELLPKD